MNGITRIQQTFAQGNVYAAYLMAGDGGLAHSLQAALALVAGGVNLLEIGVPFSDPIADGPVIQRAARRALAAKITMKEVLQLIQMIKQHVHIPIILFSYLNPLLTIAENDFFPAALKAGVDGILLVDCPPEEESCFREKCLAHHIAPIYVIAPSTDQQRLQKINQAAQGFLYYACRNGTTGIRADLPEEFAERIQFIKQQSDLPVLAGFGISSRTTVKQVLQHTEGVVVGSLFVKAIEEGTSFRELRQLAENLFSVR